jgi:hypothetical protein
MAGTAVVVGTIGALSAPSDEEPLAHAAMWGGSASAVAGVASLFIFDEQARANEALRQSEILKKELDSLRGEGTGSEPKLLYETSAPFGKEVPHEYHNLVSPGKWSVYQLNQWVMQGEGTLIHQDRMIRLVPPTLSPAKPELSLGASKLVNPESLVQDQKGENKHE